MAKSLHSHKEAWTPHKHINLLGKKIYFYREVSSTNSIAKQMARSGAREGTIVISRTQSAGRGRMQLHLDTNQLPPDCKETSTSLSLELSRNISRMKLLKQFIISWDEHLQGFIKEGHPYLRSKWIANNVTIGKNVSINKKDYSIDGLAVDVSEKGGLIVRLSDGSLQEFLAEDVSLRNNC